VRYSYLKLFFNLNKASERENDSLEDQQKERWLTNSKVDHGERPDQMNIFIEKYGLVITVQNDYSG
ncbi:hypothetical protein THOM_1630, partial [Trachipleistophora hominis]